MIFKNIYAVFAELAMIPPSKKYFNGPYLKCSLKEI